MIKRIDAIRPYVTSGGDRPAAGGDRSAARDGVRRVEAATVVHLSEFAQRRNRERERARQELANDAAAEETAAATGDAIRRQPDEATAAQPASPRDRVWLLTESGS